MINPVEAAKLVRSDLKTTFPTIKFSVTVRGGSVYVRHESTTPREKINKVVGKYEAYTFNAMEDIREIKPTNYVGPQAEYVLVMRGL